MTESSGTTSCGSCCYWSELIAKTRCGVLVAVCLSGHGTHANAYTRGDNGCDAWELAADGAIDDPESKDLAGLRSPQFARP